MGVCTARRPLSFYGDGATFPEALLAPFASKGKDAPPSQGSPREGPQAEEGRAFGARPVVGDDSRLRQAVADAVGAPLLCGSMANDQRCPRRSEYHNFAAIRGATDPFVHGWVNVV